MQYFDALRLQHLWLAAHGPASAKVLMSAVALAESRGSMSAVNHRDPYGGSFCAWQVNGVHGYNHYRLLHDPSYCARAAVHVYRTSGPNAWSTYRYREYRPWLPGAREAALHDLRLAMRHRHTAHVAHKTHAGSLTFAQDQPFDAMGCIISFVGISSILSKLRLFSRIKLALRREIVEIKRLEARKARRKPRTLLA